MYSCMWLKWQTRNPFLSECVSLASLRSARGQFCTGLYVWCACAPSLSRRLASRSSRSTVRSPRCARLADICWYSSWWFRGFCRSTVRAPRGVRLADMCWYSSWCFPDFMAVMRSSWFFLYRRICVVNLCSKLELQTCKSFFSEYGSLASLRSARGHVLLFELVFSGLRGHFE